MVAEHDYYLICYTHDASTGSRKFQNITYLSKVNISKPNCCNMSTQCIMIPFIKKRIQLSTEFIEFTKTVVLLSAFLIVCVAFYSFYEGWTLISSLTFTVVTMSTVGKI